MGTYKYLTSVEIIEYLCQGSANGFRKVYLDRVERRLGLPLPAVLRDFLLRVGRERVCIGEREFFSPASFRKREGYLVIGSIEGAGIIGISLEDTEKEDPPVYLRNVWGRWDALTESMEAYLLVELDRRMRRTKIARYQEHADCAGHLSRYFYCKWLMYKEQAWDMDPSEVFVPVEKWDDIFPEKDDGDWEDWEDDEAPDGEGNPEDDEDWDYGEDLNDDEDWDADEAPEGDGETVIIPQELKDFLSENKVSYIAAPYCIAICREEETGILYSACFPKNDRRFASLLRISASDISNRDRYAEKLLNELAEKVHSPVMGHCLKKLFLLPEGVRELADEELHIRVAGWIDDFLEIFEKNRSWKLGVCESDRFIRCSGVGDWEKGETLPTIWYCHHLKEDPPFWNPAYRRRIKEEEEAAPKELEPFLKELFYRAHDYSLLNRYAFLAGKIVKKEGYSKRIENYTEEERFALLSFYREMADGVMERILDCLEKRIFSIRIGDRDFTEFCGDPTAHLAGWMNRYERKDLAFLDEGCWR